MPGQAELLVERMKKDSNVDFENDWKVITIFVGGNDLCDYCDNKVHVFTHIFLQYCLCAQPRLRSASASVG